MPPEPLLSQVERYYSARFAEHGATAAGVDWRDETSQRTRFAQLARLWEGREDVSVLDVGCGYGALVEFLEERGEPFAYQGADLSAELVASARERHPNRTFVTATTELEPGGYAVASGIFNVRLETGVEAWTAYVLETLDELDRLGTRGFAFNMLTSYSDPERMRDDLYYGDPAFFFDHCKRRHAPAVALLHDYGLWEFTLLVRKDVA